MQREDVNIGRSYARGLRIGKFQPRRTAHDKRPVEVGEVDISLHALREGESQARLCADVDALWL